MMVTSTTYSNVYSYTTSVVEVFETRYCTISLLKTILTWRGSKSDHGGVSSRARLFHCTRTGLTPAITANVGNSTIQFLVVGVCVRAHPLHYTIKTPVHNMLHLFSCKIYLIHTYLHIYIFTYLHTYKIFIHLHTKFSKCLTVCQSVSHSSLIQAHIFIC